MGHVLALQSSHNSAFEEVLPAGDDTECCAMRHCSTDEVFDKT